MNRSTEHRSAPLLARPQRPPRRALARGWAIASGVVIAAGASACGELSGTPELPTLLLTVEGTVTAPPTTAAPKNLHVTVLWRTLDVTSFRLGDDVALAGPSPFRLEIRTPPPEIAKHRVVLTQDEATSLGFAVGALIAYDDLDGDGRLGLRPGRAEVDRDVFVAADASKMLVWFDRAPGSTEATLVADRTGQLPRAGLNFLVFGANGPRWELPTKPYDLAADKPARVPDRVCSTLYESPAPESKPTVYDLLIAFPPVGAPGLVCFENGNSFTYEPCTQSGLCLDAPSCRLDVRRLGFAEQVPKGWPCSAR